MREKAAGFTLVELLVSLALLGIILAAVFNFFMRTNSLSAQTSGRAELQQEILNAQQLIIGKMKEAWYIYPAGQNIVLSASDDPTVRNPITGTRNWITSTHPILAMILPPQDALMTCSANVAGCYQFIAYYPVTRSVWLNGTLITPERNPGADDSNNSTWILAEYRASMPNTFTPSATVPTVPLNGTANILSDYVAPSNTTGNPYTMFTLLSANGAVTSTTNPVTGVTFNLAVTRQTGGVVLRLPDPTNEYAITVYPTNLGKIGAS